MRTCLLLFLAALICPAAQPPLHVNWGDLAVVTGHQVSIATASGVVRGKAMAVEADALVVQAKGKPVRVPRASLRRFEMQTKGAKYRILGTTLGSFAGLAAGVGAAFALQGGIAKSDHDAAAATACFGLWGAGTAGGYLLGNAGDKRWTPVEILD